MDFVEELIQAIKPKDDEKIQKTYDAVVSSIDDDGVVWVYVAGSETETPTASAASEVKRGDAVKVEWRNNKLYIAGNYTNPASGVSRVYAVEKTTIETAKAIRAQEATIVNLQAEKADITELTAATARITDLEADHVSTSDLTATTGRITNLETNKANVSDLTAAKARIDDLEANALTADSAVITNLQANKADVSDLTAATGRITTLEANALTADSAVITDLQANKANVTDLTAAKARITDLEANKADVDYLEANYADIDLANVNNAWIQNGVVKDAAISDAQIIGVSANKLTAGTIDASNITVTNLNASNITVGTLNGQRIGTGSLSLDKLSEDVYTEAEVDAKLATMQDEIDGAIETWTGSVVPTLNNSPASGWTTTADKDKHVGDVYYVVNAGNQADGYCYRFAKSGSTYSWVLIKDSDVTAALQRLLDAEGDIDDLQSFESTTSSWITQTDEELRSIKSNHTSLVTVVDKTLVETVQLWFTKANTTAPNKPTAHVTTNNASTANAWNQAVPTYNASYPNYFYCYEWKYADGSYGWSAVTRDIAMGETQSTGRTAASNASAAVSTANTASSNASTALSTANTAAADASDAKSDASTALSTATTASTDASTALSTANTASTNASTAVSTANTAKTTADSAQTTANANIKSTVQLWFTKANTTAPGKPSAHVTTNNASTANAWNIAVPTYNASYPNYFYCYEYQKGDNSYSWSDVVYDRATTENQANARSALSQVATKVETSTFNELSQTVDENSASITSLSTTVESKADSSTVTTLSNTVNSVSQTASSNSSKISNLTSRLGTNADGTAGANDIVAKESALEQDLSGFKTTVSSTYATNTNLTAEINKRKATYGTSATAAGTANKVVTCSNFELYTGARVAVTFSYANTATTPALNVNSTGAKTIKSYSGAALTEAEYKWAAGSTLEFVYDGSYWRLEDEGTLKRLSTAEGTISSHTTSIQQNSEAIALKANSTDVYTKTQTDGLISTEVTNRNAAIQASADSITSSVSSTYATKTEFNNLEIGGKNLLVGTGTSVSKATTATTSFVTQRLYSTPDSVMLSDLGFAVNDEVTLSFDWKVTSATTYGNARIEWYGKTSSYDLTYIASLINPFATFSASNTSGHVSTTVKLTSSTINAKMLYLRIDNSNLTLTISNLKLERGNKATDWTPAPEDLEAYTDSAVTTAKSEIKQTTDAITSTVSTKVGNDEVISKINQSAESITISANKINIEGAAIFGNYSTTQQMNDAISGAVDGIEVGGRNLFKDPYTSKQSITLNGLTLTFDPTDSTFTVSGTNTKTDADWSFGRVAAYESFLSSVIKANTNYTLSLYGMPSGMYLQINGYNSSGREIALVRLAGNGSVQHYSFQIPSTADLSRGINAVFFGVFSTADSVNGTFRIKLEEGNKGTDWSRAPESTLNGSYLNSISNENLAYGTPLSSTGGADTGNFGYYILYNVNKMLANMTADTDITVSFYAKADAAVSDLAVYAYQSSGRSIGAERIYINLTTSWQRFVIHTKVTDHAGTYNNGSIMFFYKSGDTTKKYIRMLQIERGLNVTPWNEPPAAHYVTFVDSTNGIKVHDADDITDYVQVNSSKIAMYRDGVEKMQLTDSLLRLGDTSNYAKIDGTGMNVYKGGTSVAMYGDTARIGKETNGGKVVIANSGIDMYGYNASASTPLTNLCHIGYSEGNADSGTKIAPYYTFGTRASGSAVGNYSVAEGKNTTASSIYSHAEGDGSTANSYGSHAEGYNTTASGSGSHAEGQNTTASNAGSHAEGYNTTASGIYSHAEGRITTANSSGSHAEGQNTTASGYDSHAEGYNTTAHGNYSHAEGQNTTASGRCSHAQNFYTTANTKSQTVIGEYNVLDTGGGETDRGDYAFIIGNGTADNSRSNALTVDWSGNVKLYLDTNATSGSTDGDLYAAITALGWTSDVIE